jgi:hypothetical protein
MEETLERFMTLVDISGECWLAKPGKKGTLCTKSIKGTRSFPVLGEKHYHRICYALMFPEKHNRLASITRLCQTPLCCRGDHYTHGVLNECHPRPQHRL